MKRGTNHDRDRCLLCYANGRKRSNYRGHFGYRRPRPPRVIKQWEEAAMKRPSSGDGLPGGGVPAKGATFSQCPRLWELLTEDKWDDGTDRERSTLLVLMDGPAAKVWLNDRSTDRTAWASGETVDQAIASLEEMLETDTVPWRTSEGARKKRKQS